MIYRAILAELANQSNIRRKLRYEATCDSHAREIAVTEFGLPKKGEIIIVTCDGKHIGKLRHDDLAWR